MRCASFNTHIYVHPRIRDLHQSVWKVLERLAHLG